MTAIQVRTELHQLIDTIEDIGILNAIKILLQKQSKPNKYDFWDMLPSQIQDSINTGINQAEEGKTENHEEVMKEVITKYKL